MLVSQGQSVADVTRSIGVFESEWTPALGPSLLRALADDQHPGRLDLGCIAAKGHFSLQGLNYECVEEGKPATAFLFKLIEKLQFNGTVPMIDIAAYAK